MKPRPTSPPSARAARGARPLLLIVLDGWGQRAQAAHNALHAHTPFFHELLERYPHSQLVACGEEVGLPLGVMGNSEVGHMNLGAGRVVYQDVSRIDRSIRSGEFFDNPAIGALMERVRREGKRLHLLGLVSDGGVHASDLHLRSLLQMAARRGLAPDSVLVHAITDGRDTPPRSGMQYVEQLQKDIDAAGVGRIATLTGRFWAMDRDKRWERVERAYDLFTLGQGERFETALDALSASYAADKGDEFVEPAVIGAPEHARIEEGDGVFCFNYRSDRMREICEALQLDAFDGFERKRRVSFELVTATRYRADYPFAIAFDRPDLEDMFPEIISAAGLRQARVAETEKYAHVTFFFSGGREAPLPGEERILVPSPKVATYDLQPEMSAEGVTRAVLDALEKDETDVYVINYANADMVGHTGMFDATCQAVAKVDSCLARIVPAVVQRGGAVVITADHGNAEMLWDEVNDQPHTAHTLNPVPIVFCSSDVRGAKLRPQGVLADVAPSLLELLGLSPSARMNGVSLFRTA